METTLIWAVIVVALGVVVVRTSVIIVRQGYEYTLERFGRYSTTLRPGFHLIVPFVNRVGHRVNMMERVLDVPSQEVISKDNAVLTVDGVVFFQVLDAPKAAYEVFRLEHAILNLTMTNIRTVLGSMDLDDALSKRDDINARLLVVVDEATTPWGIKVTRIEIKDISPPNDLVAAMARQMKAERDKRATILEAEGTRQAAILEAEGEKQAAILQADGRKEAAYRDAEARERLAEAEARATTMVSEAIASGNIQAVNYFVAQKYVEALGQFATGPNNKTLLLPVEATGILSSLAGITEVAKEAFGKDRDAGQGGRDGMAG
jgi:regulator of protease activity HflC (stomatin/prohibitin superfamily)